MNAVAGTWRAYESAGFRGEWGVATNDPKMVEAGDEIIVYPSLNEAHARLISAAPDLADAVTRIVAWKDALSMVAPELGGLLAAIYVAEATLTKSGASHV